MCSNTVCSYRICYILSLLRACSASFVALSSGSSAIHERFKTLSVSRLQNKEDIVVIRMVPSEEKVKGRGGRGAFATFSLTFLRDIVVLCAEQYLSGIMRFSSFFGVIF